MVLVGSVVAKSFFWVVYDTWLALVVGVISVLVNEILCKGTESYKLIKTVCQ